MKRFVWAILCGVLGAFVFISLVAAAPTTSCGQNDNNQLIMLISSDTNAHGSEWNASDYPIEICYNELFGSLYTGSPHVCTPGETNRVLRLSETANAHAESASLNNYPVQVCYGDLACTTRTTACPVGEKEVVFLSGLGNAHLETNDSDFYVNRVCCSTGGVGSGEENFTLLQWQNSAGQPIGVSYNAMTHVNWTVRLIAFTKFPVGTNLTFEVWDKDLLLDDFIRSFTALTYQSPTNPDLRIAAITDYKITDADIQKANEPGEFTDGKVEFYFKAKTTNPAISNEVNLSEILDVNITEGPNTPPYVNIVAPIHRGIYYNGTTVEFKQNSSDSQGPITLKWTIEEDGFSTTQSTFNYTLKKHGQKTITLRATDQKGLWREDQVAILSVASPGMFSYINEPFHRQIIKTTTFAVKFSANDSYVVNNQGTCPSTSVTCLAGNCPVLTENYPPGCLSKISVSGTPQNFNSLLFNWAFDDGTGTNGAGLVEGIKQYISGSEGERTITLVLNYTDTPLSAFFNQQTKRLFTLINVSQCINNGMTYIVDPFGSAQQISTMAPGGYCSGPDGNNETTNDNCCPPGNQCTAEGCVPTGLNECKDYNSLGMTACNLDEFNLADIDPSGSDPPACGTFVNGSLVSCACEWNGTISAGVCNLARSYIAPFPGPQCNPNKCILEPTQLTECINGYLTVNVSATFVAGAVPACTVGETKAECEAHGGLRTILCGKPTVAFGFFDQWQVMTSIAIIALIYFLVYKKRK